MKIENISTSTAWLLFIVFSIVTIAALFIIPQWFWLFIPFPLTFLVQAMRLM